MRNYWKTRTISVKELIELGADLLDGGMNPNISSPSAPYSTLPLLAAECGQPALLKLLLARGASPNVTVPQGRERGRTPLHGACYSGRRDLIALLVDAGAELDAVTEAEGFTPLQFACFTNNMDIAKQLMDYGADVSVRDKQGRTPVELAVAQRWLTLPRALALLGKQPKVKLL